MAKNLINCWINMNLHCQRFVCSQKWAAWATPAAPLYTALPFTYCPETFFAWHQFLSIAFNSQWYFGKYKKKYATYSSLSNVIWLEKSSISHAFSPHLIPSHQHLALATVYPGGKQAIMRDTVWDGKTQKMVLPDGTAKRMKLVFHISRIQTIWRIPSVAWSIIQKKKSSNTRHSNICTAVAKETYHYWNNHHSEFLNKDMLLFFIMA